VVEDVLKPFLKWAGGKSQLLSDIRQKYPKDLGISINKYCEPFIGGGAVLFDLLSKYKFKEVFINDINLELTNTYKIIKNNVWSLIKLLEKYQNEFIPFDSENRKKYFYSKRERFNSLKVTSQKEKNIEKAALFIFLNKTCFNGLFRVNSSGLFNVPMGAYKNPLICNKENLLEISRSLENVQINCGDYKECLSFIDKNTFVYIDPPYRPLTQTASFTAYSENPFNDKEQIELGEFVNKITEIGAKVVLSNSDPKNSNVKDSFFDDLYSAFSIERISAKRMINSNSAGRGKISEILVMNY
jgi:DNA adenine methylase